jgi:hypothetical protein
MCQHDLFLVNILNHFQDDDEADTVGCCTLKVDNVTCMPPNKIQVLIFNIIHHIHSYD